jgi:hypothetical protein
MAEPAPDRRRSSFGPVVLVGLASAGLAAVAGSKPWVSGESGGVRSDDGGVMGSILSIDSVAESPLAAALSLVVLACWGVLLVTRGRFRRAVAVLALVTALGLVAATVEAFFNLPDALADSLLEVSGVDTKYDAPTGVPGADDTATEEPPTENIDIWKALDEGRDPTA